jgi:hypothetical protein
MSDRIWGRLGRLDIATSLVTFAVGLPVTGAMTYLASVTDWLAAWGPVAWGAIGIVSGGAAALLFALAGRVRDRRATPALEARIAALEGGTASPPAAAAATLPNGGARTGLALVESRVAQMEGWRSGFVEQLDPVIAALRTDVDRALDAIKHNAKAMRDEDEAGLEKLRAAIHSNMEAVREENAARFEMIRKTAEHALEQGRRREEALEAQLKAVVKTAESHTKAVFGVLRDTFDPKFDNLDGKIEEYATRLILPL